MKQYYEQQPIQAEKYNIFDVLEVSEKEVLCLSFTEDELKDASVYKEYLIADSDKRIDIVIEIGNRFIPIEVKINARDQEAQCYDYFHYAVE